MAIIKKFLLLCLIILLGVVPAWSATTNVNDIDGLRSALSSANDGDIIILNTGNYDLTSTLTINKSITLRGNNASNTIIRRSSGATSKFSNITISKDEQIMVILQNLTIQDASSDQNGAGIYYNASGTLSIDNCIITNNQSSNRGGGIYNNSGTANITNSTITSNNTDSYGGGFYNNESTANITNCTITGNNANNNGREIYNDNDHGTVSALNTLIWNQSNAIYGNLTLTNCAVPSSITGTNLVTLSSWPNPVSSSVTVDGVTHTVFTIDNNKALMVLVGRGTTNNETPAYDQIGTTRANPPTIGALEGTIPPITISCDVELGVTKGYSRDITLSADLNDDYKEWPISWSISPDVNDITLSGNILRVSESLGIGIYSFDIIATITSGSVTRSDDETITVTVYPYPVITISEDSASGTAGSAFTQTLTAKATVNSADYTVTPVWSYTGNLPAGITLNNGSFSGTPTVRGSYQITLKVSADVTTIDSHNITISTDKNFTFSISAANVNISGIPANGTVGQSYSYDFAQNVTPNALTYTWSQTGTLPRGLTLSSAGLLSGIPTKAGSYTTKIIASSAGGTGSQDVTIVINSSGAPSYPGGSTGSKESTHNQIDSQTGESYSESVSTFTEFNSGSGAGLIIASVDLKIITESNEITYVANNELAVPVSLEVYISQDSTYYHYNRYNLSVDITNLPSGLAISGDNVFNNISLDSHDFTVYVTGSHNVAVSSYDLTIIAQVTVSGDDLILITSADHNVKVKFTHGDLVSMDINFDNKSFTYKRTERFSSSFDISEILTGVTGYFSSNTSGDLESYSLNFSSDSLPNGVTIVNESIRIAESALYGSL